MGSNDAYDYGATLTLIGIFTISGIAIQNNATFDLASNTHTDNYEVFPGLALVASAQAGKSIGLSETHFYLLPSRLLDEDIPRSAICDAYVLLERKQV